jgi:NADPH2:quinone reductase
MSCPVKSAEVMTQHISGDSLPTVMRAIRVHKFGGPEVLQLDTDVPVPKCGETQVLIKVFTVGVNPCETYMRSGHFGVGVDELPVIPGTDCAGIVVHIGSNVTKVKVGARVYTVRTTSGSYAEFTVANECHVFTLHDDLTFSQGAALGVPYFTAYRALFYKADCQRNDTVLVHGASGGVGIACCQIAAAYGLQVLATAGTERGLETLRKIPSIQAFNHNEKGYLKQIEEAAGEHGVDIVCEMQACKNLKHDISLLAKDGRIVVIGSRGQVTFSPSELFSGEKRIQGVAVFSTSEEEYSKMATALNAGVAAGWLRPVISQEFPFVDATDAHREVIDHKQGTAGKLILSV